MRLASPSGAVVELDIIGYEQPPPEVATNGDDGGDWLIIRGHCVDDAGRSWTFVDACLDTDDASYLYAWLTEVADGSIEPSDEPGFGRHMIGFAEPELRLRLTAQADGTSDIRFSLLGLAAPRWASETARGIDGYSVEIVVRTAEVRAAADAWRQQLDTYPCR